MEEHILLLLVYFPLEEHQHNYQLMVMVMEAMVILIQVRLVVEEVVQVELLRVLEQAMMD